MRVRCRDRIAVRSPVHLEILKETLSLVLGLINTDLALAKKFFLTEKLNFQRQHKRSTSSIIQTSMIQVVASIAEPALD